MFVGIRILYTDQLRQYDTGMLLVGSEVNFLHMIPPEQKSFKTLGRCTSECTEKVLIKKKIYLFLIMPCPGTATTIIISFLGHSFNRNSFD